MDWAGEAGARSGTFAPAETWKLELWSLAAERPRPAAVSYGKVTVVPSPLAVTEKVPVLLDVYV
jgi:hypothetical protein